MIGWLTAVVRYIQHKPIIVLGYGIGDAEEEHCLKKGQRNFARVHDYQEDYGEEDKD